MPATERRARLAPELPSVKPRPMLTRPLDLAGDTDAEPLRSVDTDRATDEKNAAKQALAEDLEGMIEGMLRTSRFATSATTKARDWARQVGTAAAVDASTDDTAFTANSLIADLAQARAPADSAAGPRVRQRQRWIDAVLVLACLLSVAAAGYFTFVS